MTFARSHPPHLFIMSWVLLLSTVPLSACKKAKTDVERAAEERAQVEKKMRESLTLFPYRAVKIAVRSSGGGEQLKEFQKAYELLAAVEKLPPHPEGLMEKAQVSAAYAALAKGVYELRSTLKDHDEDEYPMVWKVVSNKPPPEWYKDAPTEHLVFAWALALFEIVVQRGHGLSELSHYELSKATPQPHWPVSWREASWLLRGLHYCAGGFHYAADEELTRFLQTSEPHPPLPSGEPRAFTFETRERNALLRAIGYAVRAWNQHSLNREEAANDDLQKANSTMTEATVENEFTDWMKALLAARRGRYSDSADALQTLAARRGIPPSVQNELSGPSFTFVRTAKDSRWLFSPERCLYSWRHSWPAQVAARGSARVSWASAANSSVLRWF